MKLPRFTVRRMMILVAIVALLMGVETTRRKLVERSEFCEEKATYHKAKASAARGIYIDAFDPPPIRQPNDEKSARYHDEMQRKWEDGAKRPWLSVAPDTQTGDRASRSGNGWVACRCDWCKSWLAAGGKIPK